MISHQCPHCGKNLQIADQYAGKSGRCKGCRSLIDVPNSLASSSTGSVKASLTKKTKISLGRKQEYNRIRNDLASLDLEIAAAEILDDRTRQLYEELLAGLGRIQEEFGKELTAKAKRIQSEYESTKDPERRLVLKREYESLGEEFERLNVEVAEAKAKRNALLKRCAQELEKQRQREVAEWEAVEREKTRVQNVNSPVSCIHCGSTNVTFDTKGFSIGKAAAGGILLGPIGLLGGVIGSKKGQLVCLRCGNRWDLPGI